jgi:transcriptional regulator of acetoin/glycerol metabolism
MPIKVLQNKIVLLSEMEGKGIDSLPSIRAEIERFEKLVGKDDLFLVTLTLAINPYDEPLTGDARVQELANAFKDHFGGFEAAARFLGVSKTTFYNWSYGKAIKQEWIELIIEKGPTEEIRERAKRLLSD